MAIKIPKAGSPFGKMLGMAAGIATGNPMAAVGSMAGDSPIGKAFGAFNMAKGGIESLGAKDAGLDAMSRRYSLLDNDSISSVSQGLPTMDQFMPYQAPYSMGAMSRRGK